MNTEDQNINYTLQDLASTTAKQAGCNNLCCVWVNVEKIYIKKCTTENFAKNTCDNISLEAHLHTADSCT
jgi:hypothetical protein